MDPETSRLIDRLQAEGRRSATLVRVSLWLDWGLVAVEHEGETHRARERIVDLLPRDQIAAMSAMKVEFRSAMVAVTAASHSIDAIYSAVRPYVPVGREIRDAWLANGTRRSSRIFETVKHGFDIGAEGSKLATDLHWLFEIRDQAVHFQEDDRDPVPHPVIAANAAPEDVMFSSESAQRSVDLLVQIVDLCTSRPRRGTSFEDLAERVNAMRPFAQLILDARGDRRPMNPSTDKG